MLQAHVQIWKIHISYLMRVLDLALQAMCDAVQLTLCRLFVGAQDHGLPAQDDGLPPRHCCFALSQQSLLLLHQLVESHLHRHTHFECTQDTFK